MDTYLKISSHCQVCGDKMEIHKFGSGWMKDMRSEDFITGETYLRTCPNFCVQPIHELTEIITCPENAAFTWNEKLFTD